MLSKRLRFPKSSSVLPLKNSRTQTPLSKYVNVNPRFLNLFGTELRAKVLLVKFTKAPSFVSEALYIFSNAVKSCTGIASSENILQIPSSFLNRVV